jgi:putative membrane protein
MLLYTTVIVVLSETELLVSMPIAIPTLLGTAISILLGFRTNSAYDRWWEARKIWGAIVNDCRTFTRQVLSFLGGAEDVASLKKEMIYRQIAWCHALRHFLRGDEPLADLAGLLSEDEIETLRPMGHHPNSILQTQTVRLADARRRRLVDRLMFLPMEGTLKRFSDQMGQCERIKTTVFPTPYGYVVWCIIWLFFFMLPVSLAPHLGWFAVPVTLVVTLGFELIDSISRFLEAPFENASTDTPMTAICRTIEINLREQLGETELPAKLEPVDGVLM